MTPTLASIITVPVSRPTPPVEVPDAPTEAPWPNGWDLVFPHWTPTAPSPAVLAMLADSYDEADRLVCLDHGTAWCAACDLPLPAEESLS